MLYVPFKGTETNVVNNCQIEIKIEMCFKGLIKTVCRLLPMEIPLKFHKIDANLPLLLTNGIFMGVHNRKKGLEQILVY